MKNQTQMERLIITGQRKEINRVQKILHLAGAKHSLSYHKYENRDVKWHPENWILVLETEKNATKKIQQTKFEFIFFLFVKEIT